MIHGVQIDKDIWHLSNFKTKAFAKYYYEINNIDDVFSLKWILQHFYKQERKVLFIGWWTNLLFAFDVFEGLIIKNNLKWWNYNKWSKILEVYSSEMISDIAYKLEFDLDQPIWHRFIGLPGTIWWAVFGNAWCFWLETENNFLEAEVFHLETCKIETISQIQAEFWYRNSLFKKSGKYLILKVKFDLSTIKEKYASDVDNIQFREEIQPKWNSCGSFFKNHSKEFSAGKLIESVWLKWYHYKGAFFSDKHANFLMTDSDNWDYRDVLYLIEFAKKNVFEKYWIELQEEVRIIKN